jgi:hypothetical protein
MYLHKIGVKFNGLGGIGYCVSIGFGFDIRLFSNQSREQEQLVTGRHTCALFE